MSLGVVDESEGDVLLVELCKTRGDLVVLTLGLGGDSHGVAGFGDLDRGQLGAVLVVGHGVAGLPIHLADGDNIAAAGFGDFGALLAAHGVHTAELVVRGSAEIVEGHAGGDLAGDDLHKAELAELIRNGLEYEAGHAVVLLDGCVAVVGDALEHCNGADVGHCIACEDGNDGTILHTGLQPLDDVSLFKLHGLEKLLHELLGSACGGFHKLCAKLLNMVGICRGDCALLGLAALGNVGNVVDEVDNAGTVGGGDGDRADDGAVLALQCLKSLEVVAVLFVALGDGEHDGQGSCLEVVPAALCTDGNALARVLRGGDYHTGLDRAQRAQRVADKVKEAGAVQYVDLAAVVADGSNGGGDGYLAGDFLCVVVAYGVAVGDLAETVDSAGDVQHTLGQTGFAVIAMTQQGNIADVLGFVAHVLLPLCQNILRCKF